VVALLGVDESGMFDWATKASGSGCYCERKHDHALGGVKSSDFFNKHLCSCNCFCRTGNES
jgi:hypothetical protein